jgi:hypothetical protein
MSLNVQVIFNPIDEQARLFTLSTISELHNLDISFQTGDCFSVSYS